MASVGDLRAAGAAVAFYVLPLLLFLLAFAAGHQLGWWRRGLADDRKRSRVRAEMQRAAVARLPVQRDGER